jgi:hypothetical protein
MARSTQQIWNELIANKTEVGLPQNNSPMSFINRLLYVFALSINQYETLLDSFRTEIIDISNTASYGSYNWIRAKAFEFQYSTSNPQTVSFDPVTFKTAYPSIEEDLRIVTACSVKLTPSRQTLIKVAKGTSPSLTPLSNEELLSINSYFDFISPAGQSTNVISFEGDDMTLNLTIYYNAQISVNIIQTNTEASIREYIYSKEFDGTIVINKIIDQIQIVPDVFNGLITYAYIDNVNNRGNGTTFSVETELYSGYIRNLTLNYQYVPR